MAKSPTATTTKSMPSSISIFPKVSLVAPVIRSAPTTATVRPKITDNAPLINDLPVNDVTIQSPNKVIEKYSGGVNFIARAAKSGPKTIKPITLTVPATKPEIAARPKAGPAFPCNANGYPSIQVGTELASPGRFIRIEVTAPPYFAPQYTPAIMMIIDVGAIPKLRGRRIAIVAGVPRPGNIPTKVPTSAPKKANKRLAGMVATEKPSIIP